MQYKRTLSFQFCFWITFQVLILPHAQHNWCFLHSYSLIFWCSEQREAAFATSSSSVWRVFCLFKQTDLWTDLPNASLSPIPAAKTNQNIWQYWIVQRNKAFLFIGVWVGCESRDISHSKQSVSDHFAWWWLNIGNVTCPMFETKGPGHLKNAFLKEPCSQPSPLSPVTGSVTNLCSKENQNRKEVRRFKRQDSLFLFISHVSHSSLQTTVRQQMLHTHLLPRCCS